MIWLLLTTAWALPEGPDAFCALYADAPWCRTGGVTCTMCHDTSGAPNLNPYGADVQSELFGSYTEGITAALLAVEDWDSDDDGRTNLEEIGLGTEPGFVSDVEPECATQVLRDNDQYAVGRYDRRFAFKRVTLDFCGRSPRYQEWQDFDAELDKRAAIGAQLEACLESPYWASVLEELAYPVVRPAGIATDLSPLGNYEWDLRLFRYATSDGRDAGELFTADYYVVEDPPNSGLLAAVDEPRDESEDYAQPLDREYRHGLMTTRYSLAMNVMFSEVPRTLIAQYYRELLGMDIALSQGLYPIDEADGAYAWDAPLDVDEKGVWQQDCAACHATLDPLSYPFARYVGIDLDGDTTATWQESRVDDILPTIDGYIFGEPVSSPEEWVDVAVNSDEFAEQMTRIFWNHLFRRAPFSCDEDEFNALWQGFAADRDVEAMLANLVQTDAYGTP